MKRKWLWSLILVLGLTLTYSCDQEIEMPQAPDPQEARLAQDKLLIESMGFDVSDISDEGDYYVVEGDIAFDKKELIQTRQYSFRNGVIGKLPQTRTPREIKVGYFLGPLEEIHKHNNINSSEKSWKEAAKEAVNVWNSITNWAIKLVWVENGWADILFNGMDMNIIPYHLGHSYTPYNGDPGHQIGINVAYRGSYQTYPFTKQKQAAVHLLGHALGFAHTDNDYGLSSVELDVNAAADHIPGSASSDPLSVMNRLAILSNWSALSPSDIYAAQKLYPLLLEIPYNVQTYSQDVDITVNQGTSRSFSVNCNTAGYNLSNINWSVVGTVNGKNSTNATITFSSAGNHVVKVTGNITRDGYYPKAFSHEFRAHVIDMRTPTIAGPTNVALSTDQTFTMNNFMPAFSNAQYHWNVTGGQVVSQSGNQATIRFTQSGYQTVSGYVTQSVGSTTYTSLTSAPYSVEATHLTKLPIFIGLDLHGTSFSCKLATGGSVPIPPGTSIEFDFEVLVSGENGRFNDRVAVQISLQAGQTRVETDPINLWNPIDKLEIDYSFFNINVSGLVDSDKYYMSRSPLNRPDPLYRYDSTYRYVYGGALGSYFPKDIYLPAGAYYEDL